MRSVGVSRCTCFHLAVKLRDAKNEKVMVNLSCKFTATFFHFIRHYLFSLQLRVDHVTLTFNFLTFKYCLPSCVALRPTVALPMTPSRG